MISIVIEEEADEGVFECILNSSMKDFLNPCKHPFIIEIADEAQATKV